MVDGSLFNISADRDAMVINHHDHATVFIYCVCPNWHQILERKARCTTRTCARALTVVDADLYENKFRV